MPDQPISKAARRRRRIRRRIVRRRIRSIAELLIILFSIVILPILDNIGKTPKWIGTPLYYTLAIALVVAISAIFIIWVDASEKNDIDELEERIDQRFNEQEKLIKRVMGKK